MPFITILHVLHLSSMLPHNISHTSAFWDGACKRGLNGTEPHKTPGNRRKWVNEDSKRCRSWRPLAVQEMCVCVSRPRWCEAIFRENPKTRKRENGQENAKTAKTRKPRKRHLYTMIYGEGCRRWRVKSRNMKVEAEFARRIFKLEEYACDLRGLRRGNFAFVYFANFNTETEGIDGSRCSYMVTYIPCKEIRSADVRCENARSTDVRCKV